MFVTIRLGARLRIGIVVLLATVGIGCSSGSPSASTSPALPTLPGQWSGSWTASACSQTGSAAAANFCGGLTGNSLGLTINTQNGSTVQASLALGTAGIAYALSGQIAASGILTLTGQGSAFGGADTLNWESRVSGNSMTGGFTWTVFSPPTASPGSATVTAILQGVVKVGQRALAQT